MLLTNRQTNITSMAQVTSTAVEYLFLVKELHLFLILVTSLVKQCQGMASPSSSKTCHKSANMSIQHDPTIGVEVRAEGIPFYPLLESGVSL